MKYTIVKELYLGGRYLKPESIVSESDLRGADVKQLLKLELIKELKDDKK